MRGRPVRIGWRDGAAALFRRYQRKADLERRTRWNGPWLVRRGASLREVASGDRRRGAQRTALSGVVAPPAARRPAAPHGRAAGGAASGGGDLPVGGRGGPPGRGVFGARSTARGMRATAAAALPAQPLGKRTLLHAAGMRYRAAKSCPAPALPRPGRGSLSLPTGGAVNHLVAHPSRDVRPLRPRPPPGDDGGIGRVGAGLGRADPARWEPAGLIVPPRRGATQGRTSRRKDGPVGSCW